MKKIFARVGAGLAWLGLVAWGLALPACGASKAKDASAQAPTAVPDPLPVVFLKRKEREELALAKTQAREAAQQIRIDAGPAPEAGASLEQLVGDAPSSPRWTIVLATFPGAQGGASAERAVAFLRERGLGEGLRVEPSPGAQGGVALLGGAFASREEAQARLGAYKELDAGGGIFPFAEAMLAPLDAGRSARVGARPEFELRTAAKARGQAGGRSAIYTLQVGVYRAMDAGGAPAPEELANFRAAAEEAVMRLRQEGAEAFYYHGPTSSTICVGLFGEEDVIMNERDPATGSIRTLPTPRYSPRLVVTQQAHPYNIVNGGGVRLRRAGEAEGRLQSSFLIRVPE